MTAGTGERHTPGPWALSVNPGSPQKAYGIHAHANGWRVNVVNWGGLSRAATGEGQANARLIAAAPDMLAALRGAMVIIETCGWPDDAGDGLRAEFDRRREAIRAAIAKATAAEPTP